MDLRKPVYSSKSQNKVADNNWFTANIYKSESQSNKLINNINNFIESQIFAFSKCKRKCVYYVIEMLFIVT